MFCQCLAVGTQYVLSKGVNFIRPIGIFSFIGSFLLLRRCVPCLVAGSSVVPCSVLCDQASPKASISALALRYWLCYSIVF